MASAPAEATCFFALGKLNAKDSYARSIEHHFSRQAIGLYVDWLWFQEVGYAQVFTRSLFYKLLLGLLGGGLFFALLYFNVKIAAKPARSPS